MYIHNLDPVLFDFGLISIRWYSLSYILGILIGWWYGKKIISKVINKNENNLSISEFDDLITYIVLSIILGGRLGYVLFYNYNYYLENPFEILMIWKGGMSFHGALLGIILGCYIFSIKRGVKTFVILDVIACVSPIGIFLGRLANFINGELYGKVTTLPFGIIFPKVDNLTRHPSQLYEAFLEGFLLFIILNFILFRRDYIKGLGSSLFLILYGVFRIISEIFREPDTQVGYIIGQLTIGSILSFLMVLAGATILTKIKWANQK